MAFFASDTRLIAKTTEQILQNKSARFENICARSAAHLARTASSAAKVAQTAGPSCRSGPWLRPRGGQLDDLEPRYCRQHGRLQTVVTGDVHQ
eukprot:7124076-Prymnesium_polylepis.1